MPGVEADDVLGTLARMGAEEGMEVIISSGDKDLAQLVNAHITIIDTMNGKRRDIAGVTAEFGVPPSLMLDYQCLVGDTVDNVPGVPKVGPKTAAKWLAEYGSLANLVAHAADIKGAVGENLRRCAGLAAQRPRAADYQNRLRFDGLHGGRNAIENIAARAQNTGALADFYTKYGFKGLAAALARR